jgi:hypothetical protein
VTKVSGLNVPYGSGLGEGSPFGSKPFWTVIRRPSCRGTVSSQQAMWVLKSLRIMHTQGWQDRSIPFTHVLVFPQSQSDARLSTMCSTCQAKWELPVCKPSLCMQRKTSHCVIRKMLNKCPGGAAYVTSQEEQIHPSICVASTKIWVEGMLAMSSIQSMTFRSKSHADIHSGATPRAGILRCCLRFVVATRIKWITNGCICTRAYTRMHSHEVACTHILTPPTPTCAKPHRCQHSYTHVCAYTVLQTHAGKQMQRHNTMFEHVRLYGCKRTHTCMCITVAKQDINTLALASAKLYHPHINTHKHRQAYPQQHA